MFQLFVVLMIPMLLILLIIGLFVIYKLYKKNRLLQHERELLLRERDGMNQSFHEIRAQRHDSMIHVTAIQFLLEQEKWLEAQSYLQQLVQTLDETNQAIRGEEGHMAALLLHLQQKAKQKGIAVKYDLEAPLSELPLSAINQSKLVGNLLNNSLDAALAFAEQEAGALISVETTLRSGLYILEIKNSTLPIPKEILDSLFQSYGQTTKAGEHQGLGTYVVKKLVDDHHGKLDFVYQKKTIAIKIKLPILM